MADIHIVVGGQFGSEGKGHFTAQLAKKIVEKGDFPFTIRTGGPNAGHTVVDDEGREWKMRHLPVTAVTLPDAPIALAAGCEIDQEVLDYEIFMLETAGMPVLDRLTVDAQATLLESHHRQRESEVHSPKYDGTTLVERIGSTGKGIGAARADRMLRDAGIYGGSGNVLDEASKWLADHNRPVILEATQGFGLGLHAGYYPQCTSRDVRAIDVLSEVGLSPWQPGVDRILVWVVFRPFPIRVAGNSGPLKDETTWESLGFAPERTTVTQKIRRVGLWDSDLAHRAMVANGWPSNNWNVAINPIMMFADYIDPQVAGLADLPDETLRLMQPYERDTSTIYGYGTGPNTFAWRYDEPF